MAPIYDEQGYKGIIIGYSTHISGETTETFTVDQANTAPINFGEVLIATSVDRVLRSATDLAGGTITDAIQVLGVALATNVNLNRTLPFIGLATSTGNQYRQGEQGNNMVRGRVAVTYVGATVPTSGALVHLCTNSGTPEEIGKLSADPVIGTARIVIPAFRWFTTATADEPLAALLNIGF